MNEGEEKNSKNNDDDDGDDDGDDGDGDGDESKEQILQLFFNPKIEKEPSISAEEEAENSAHQQLRFSSLCWDADTLFRQGKFEAALHCYTSALEEYPLDNNVLTCKSKCLLNLGFYDEALIDIDKSYDIDKSNIQTISTKADILFVIGKFEFALVYYQRGKRLRPEMESFRLGIRKSMKAINDAFIKSSSNLSNNSNSNNNLLLYHDIIELRHNHCTENQNNINSNISSFRQRRTVVRNSNVNCSSSADRDEEDRDDRTYLRQSLVKDKKYLQVLLQELNNEQMQLNRKERIKTQSRQKKKYQSQLEKQEEVEITTSINGGSFNEIQVFEILPMSQEHQAGAISQRMNKIYASNTIIQNIAKKGISFINQREDFWRQRQGYTPGQRQRFKKN